MLIKTRKTKELKLSLFENNLRGYKNSDKDQSKF